MPDVVTFGETMALFAPRETGPLRYVAEYRLKMGGTESNMAVALARLGIEVGWFSRVGDDEMGRFIVHNVRGEGVDTSRVIVDAGAPTGIFLKEISGVGTTTVYYYRHGSAASRMEPNDLDVEYLTGAAGSTSPASRRPSPRAAARPSSGRSSWGAQPEKRSRSTRICG